MRAFPLLGFRLPTNLVQPDDASDLLFTSELAGRVLVFTNDQQTGRTSLFLDISDRVIDDPQNGLLGLAFDPEYGTNGRFYVFYGADDPDRSVLARYTVSKDDPRQADASSEFIILEVPQPGNSTDVGGQLAFGSDGYLYLSLGHVGQGDHSFTTAQDLGSLWGKILRIDVSDLVEGERYRIPPDNPFAAYSDIRPEIWAYGFRNPWRFSFDVETGRLWAGDAGEKSWEEIDLVEKGGNYGWNVFEGSYCFPPGSICSRAGLQFPVVSYGHDQGCAVIGGYVYLESEIPSLAGAYVYGDFCTGKVWAFKYDGDSVIEHQLLVDSDLLITSFGQDRAGNLYILSSAGQDGFAPIYRLAPKE